MSSIKGKTESFSIGDTPQKEESYPEKLPWGRWEDYSHVVHDGREYALVGDLFFGKEAVARIQPSGMRYGGKDKRVGWYGRSIPPTFVKEAIDCGKTTIKIDKKTNEERHEHKLGTLVVVTTKDDKHVITTFERL